MKKKRYLMIVCLLSSPSFRKEINEVVVRHRPPQLAQRSLVQGARVRQI